MIKEYSSKANMGILAGIVLQIGSRVAAASCSAQGVSPGVAIALLVGSLGGLGLFIWGCCMYAKAKGRSAGWGAFGLLSLIGLVVLVCLKDYAKDGYVQQARGFEVQPPPQY